MTEIISLYSDGGTISRKTVLLGGTWAWVHVDKYGDYVQEAAGAIPAEEIARPEAAGWLMEMYALMRGLEALPGRWSGYVRCDSMAALAVVQGRSLSSLPIVWERRVRMARRRLGKLIPEHVGGHPTRTELSLGHRHGNGQCMVSRHNVYVDRRCHEEGVKLYRSIICAYQPQGQVVG